MWNSTVQLICGISQKQIKSLSVEDLSINFSADPIVVTLGHKNVGKSTFNIFLVNRLLNRYQKVAWLETDPGQPRNYYPSNLTFPTY